MSDSNPYHSDRYPFVERHPGTPTNVVRAANVATLAAAFVAARNNVNLEAWWLAHNGMDPDEAMKRSLGASVLRNFWAMLWLTTCVPFYFAGCVFAVGGYDVPPAVLPLEMAFGVILAAVSGYGGLLLAAHIWRWQAEGVANPAPWWRLARRPTVMEMSHTLGAPGMSPLLNALLRAVAYVFIYGPLLGIPLYVLGLALAEIAMT